MIKQSETNHDKSTAMSQQQFCVLLICICLIPGIFAAKVVTLESIEVFTTHELLSTTPTVYFHCQGENATTLPDVKKKSSLYTFRGEESWQPLTEFAENKCKRCGFYEKDTLKSDDVYDEWEFCPSDFTSDGRNVHFKEKELNATFLCLQCIDSIQPSEGAKEKNTVVVVVISLILSVICIFGAVAGYKYWRKRKRQQEQARFLKLFEEGDELEDEFGIDHV